MADEEVRLHAITMENLNIILDIFRNLERHALTAKHMTIIWSDVRLIAKWKARNVVGPNPMQNLNPNPNTTLNVKMIVVEPRESSVVVAIGGGTVTKFDQDIPQE